MEELTVSGHDRQLSIVGEIRGFFFGCFAQRFVMHGRVSPLAELCFSPSLFYLSFFFVSCLILIFFGPQLRNILNLTCTFNT